MAIANEILTGRYNRALEKLLSLKGAAHVRQIAGEIVPMLPFFYGAEHRYLEAWNKFGIGSFVAAQGVGIAAGLRLRNPTSSNIIIVVERIGFSEPAADTVLLEHIPPSSAADLASSTRGILLMDNRASLSSASQALNISTGIVSSGNANAGGGGVNQVAQIQIPANQNVEAIITDIQEFAIAPGSALNIRSQLTNNTLTGTIWWRERLLEESERQ